MAVVVLLQGVLRLPDAPAHLKHALQLIPGVSQFREEFRGHAPQFLVCLVHGHTTLVDDVQGAEGALAEAIEISDVRLILVRDGDGLAPQVVFQFPVLVIKGGVRHNARLIGLVK